MCCGVFFFLEDINQCDHKSAVDSVILRLRLVTEHNKGALVTFLSHGLSLLLHGLWCAFKRPEVVDLAPSRRRVCTARGSSGAARRVALKVKMVIRARRRLPDLCSFGPVLIAAPFESQLVKGLSLA